MTIEELAVRDFAAVLIKIALSDGHEGEISSREIIVAARAFGADISLDDIVQRMENANQQKK